MLVVSTFAVVPQTPNWDDTIRIAGYAYPSAEMDDHKPQKSLQVFSDVKTDHQGQSLEKLNISARVILLGIQRDILI